MFLAQVIGTVVAPVQIPVLDGKKLLVVRPVDPEGQAAGKTRIAIDIVGAGEGDRVLVIDEGNSGRQLLDAPDGAVKTLIVGFVDAIERDGSVVYDHRTGDIQ
jgi:ethanolamine utilization protein EutN